MVQHIASDLARAVKTGFDSEGITQQDELMLQAIHENLFVFSGFKNYQQIKEASELLLDEEGKLKDKADFINDALQLNDKYNKAYLSTEWNHAVTGSMAISKWQTIQRDKRALPFLEYDTMEDDRVRPEHAALDKITKRVDDPFWDKFYPPNDWNCRCTVRQIDDGEVSDVNASDLTQPPKMFANNIGKTGVIFPETHPYFEASQSDHNKVMRQLQPLLPQLKNYKTTHTTGNGGKVQAHETHIGRPEFKPNEAIAKLLADKLHEKVTLLPVSNAPGSINPDALRDGVKWEFKTVKTLTPNAIDGALRAAAHQADNVLLHFPPGADINMIKKAMAGRVRRTNNLKRVDVIIGKQIYRFTRNELT